MEKKASDKFDLDIFELVDDRVIVASCRDRNMIVTWNESITFQVWLEDQGRFTEVDLWTTMETPSLAEAKVRAGRYLDTLDRYCIEIENNS